MYLLLPFEGTGNHLLTFVLLSLFQRDVLDVIWDLIESSVSEDFLSTFKADL